MLRKALLITTMALGLVTAASAEYWNDSQGNIVRSGFDLCWVNSEGTWNDTDARLLECGDAELVTYNVRGRLLVPSTDLPGGKLNFDFDSAEVDAHAEETIKAVNHVVPNGADVVVVGHTDAVGTDEYNMRLGQERAEAVGSQLLEDMNVVADSLGERDLLVDTDARERANRRVEISATWTEERERIERFDRP